MVSQTTAAELPQGAMPQNQDFTTTGQFRLSIGTSVSPRRLRLPESVSGVPGPSVGTSEYKQEYTHKEVPRTQAVVQPPRPYAPLKFEGTSTHKSDYQQWELPPPRRPQAVNEPVSLPFQGASTYRNDFDHKALPEKRRAEKMQWTPNPAKFEAVSSYREAHDEKPVCKAQSVKPVVQAPPPLPFEGTSTYGETYKQWELERQAPMPRGARVAQPDNRDFGSTYQTSFKQYEIARRPMCPMDHLPTPLVPPDPRRQHIFWDPVAQQWY